MSGEPRTSRILPRNVRFLGDDPPALKGEWVAVPAEDFDALRAEAAATSDRLSSALTDALIATLRRDDLCDDTEGEHHTDDFIAAFLMALDTELSARAALSSATGTRREGADR